MCCNCADISLCLGNAAYVIQRLASCIAAAAVVSCIMATLLIMLSVGVGAGYHYCFVEAKLNATLSGAKLSRSQKICAKPDMPKENTDDKSTEKQDKRKRRSKDLIVDESAAFHNQSNQPSTTQSTLEIKPTMVVPVKHSALIILIRNLQEKNKNFTLELIAALK